MPCRQLTKAELQELLDTNPGATGFTLETDCEEECGVCCVVNNPATMTWSPFPGTSVYGGADIGFRESFAGPSAADFIVRATYRRDLTSSSIPWATGYPAALEGKPYKVYRETQTIQLSVQIPCPDGSASTVLANTSSDNNRLRLFVDDGCGNVSDMTSTALVGETAYYGAAIQAPGLTETDACYCAPDGFPEFDDFMGSWFCRLETGTILQNSSTGWEAQGCVEDYFSDPWCGATSGFLAGLPEGMVLTQAQQDALSFTGDFDLDSYTPTRIGATTCDDTKTKTECEGICGGTWLYDCGGCA